MADQESLCKMFDRASSLVSAARLAYPKAGDQTIQIVCEETVKMVIEGWSDNCNTEKE